MNNEYKSYALKQMHDRNLFLNKQLKEKDKEIERLNNIINEFDKWLEEESEKENYSVGHLTCLMMSKVKLQELKDSDKE